MNTTRLIVPAVALAWDRFTSRRPATATARVEAPREEAGARKTARRAS